ncbi:hypothetical protein BST27_17780, partial [Mycobacterium intermedium]
KTAGDNNRLTPAAIANWESWVRRPWQHTRHWLTTKRPNSVAGSAPQRGTLLGQRTDVVSNPPSHLWQARLGPDSRPYPGRHRFHGTEVVPASVVLHTMLCAAAELGFSGLSDVRFEQPVFLTQPRVVQVFADGQSISLASSPATDTPPDSWTRHAVAQLASTSTVAAGSTDSDIASTGLPNGHSEPIPDVADLLALRGVDGVAFQWSLASWRTTPSLTTLAATVALPDALPDGSVGPLLDAAVLVGALADVSDTRLYVPASIAHVAVTDLESVGAASRGSLTVQRNTSDADGVTVDVTVAPRGGAPLASIRSLRYRALDLADTQLAQTSTDARKFVHTIDWQPRTDPAGAQVDPASVVVVESGFALNEVSEARYVVYRAPAQADSPPETDVEYAVRVAAEVTALVRALAQRDPQQPASLWILTREVHESVSPDGLRQSFLWGLAGVIAAEHPELWGGLIDLAADDELDEALLGAPSKSILVVRDGEVLAPSLAPISGPPARAPLHCRPDAAYLITGGLGALGVLMAGWLVDRGARRLVLRLVWKVMVSSVSRCSVPMLVYLVPCWAVCSVSMMAWVSSGWALISMKVWWAVSAPPARAIACWKWTGLRMLVAQCSASKVGVRSKSSYVVEMIGIVGLHGDRSASSERIAGCSASMAGLCGATSMLTRLAKRSRARTRAINSSICSVGPEITVCRGEL